jgi:glycosyltransferase involved in cell wall biosynthesis
MKNSELPWVSVVTPAYNQGMFLRDTIESVLSQDYPNIELLVLNDGSTDETESILQEYTGRIRWETQKNIGQTATINKGWRMTKGEIITWLNSDDTFMHGGVRKGVEYLTAHPETSIVFADSLFTTADGTPLEESRPLPAFNYKNFITACENPVAQPSSFIRREVVEKTGELDTSFYYFMDWDFWLRAGLYFKIDYIKGVWSTYRLHPESKTVSQSIKVAPELEFMYKKFFSRQDLPLEIKHLKNKAMMNMYFTTGGYYVLGKDQKSAAKVARAAFKQNPMGIFSFKNLHKFIFCHFGLSPWYQKLKKLKGVK